jgi:hypothetical protein
MHGSHDGNVLDPTSPVERKVTLQAWISLQYIKWFIFNTPCQWIPPPKNLSSTIKIIQEREIDNDYPTTMNMPYEPEEDDEYILYPEGQIPCNSSTMVFTAYKHVDKKIHPISMQLPTDCEVIQ